MGKGVADGRLVGVGDSRPVMGIPNWAVWVCAAAKVCTMDVLMALGSSVGTASGAQAWVAINNTETNKRGRHSFNIFFFPSATTTVAILTIKGDGARCNKVLPDPPG